jgi:hypothetical protein
MTVSPPDVDLFDAQTLSYRIHEAESLTKSKG